MINRWDVGLPSDAVDLNDHGYAEVYAEVYSEGDTFENSEGVKEECWETDILLMIYSSMSHAARRRWLKHCERAAGKSSTLEL